MEIEAYEVRHANGTLEGMFSTVQDAKNYADQLASEFGESGFVIRGVTIHRNNFVFNEQSQTRYNEMLAVAAEKNDITLRDCMRHLAAFFGGTRKVTFSVDFAPLSLGWRVLNAEKDTLYGGVLIYQDGEWSLHS